MILELIVAASDHRRKSSYATVSLEFQTFFETRNFRSLRIQSSCLDDLDRMVRGKWGGRRVGYVERICLCVDPDRQQGWRKNQASFPNVISNLLHILSRWRKAGEREPELTLELMNIYGQPFSYVGSKRRIRELANLAIWG
ncbi:hypothetical protein M430DRAFT_198910 [Amorphotheca resinae ATCC 22711]|uniref:Uncharacterized protein n=1 Tax=Amorphotheca resinae ATCC 22711 TaxID=857342 RepID=A0A2T3BA28_AMORE|nr:hypothetical protein M430DRAFT_198910 [Amorphotheca resinae ATCC 22711]PSS25148.1 hypothetical protein M430DRAFT_198910 [Amorphotheca resinae ATCC 22711]